MTRGNIKEILLLYRPGTRDAEDPQVAGAIELAKHDPELGRWFGQHQIFQVAMQAMFRQIETPERFKISLIARQKVLLPPPAFWQRPVWLAVGAALVLFVFCVATVWLQPRVPDRFGNYRDMMVSKAIRGYVMEWETTNMRQLRELIAARVAPANYELTKGLQHLQLAGGAVFPWRSNPVTMVCFRRSDRQMVFLFVMRSAAVKDPPPPNPVRARVSDILTASWTHGDMTFLLAGPDDDDFAKYLPAF